MSEENYKAARAYIKLRNRVKVLMEKSGENNEELDAIRGMMQKIGFYDLGMLGWREVYRLEVMENREVNHE